jgi:bacillithiol synthase
MSKDHKNLKLKNISLKDTNQFGTLFLDYISHSEKLKPFFGAFPVLESFENQMKVKKSSFQNRKVLHDALTKQYDGFDLHPKVSENLGKLVSDNCFTITTGHQLCLATGPIYFIYKILTTIRLAEELKKAYPENDFVPVFWMATEDHDLEEINHFYLFGKKFEWQPYDKGAAGKVRTEGLNDIFATVPDCPKWLSDVYNESANLAEATRKLVNQLFAEYGIVIIDGDDRILKSLFINQIKSDLLDKKYSPIVKATSEELEKEGYKAQAFVRERNFFYLTDGIRHRIDNSKFEIGNEQIIINQQLITEKPEKFSPNVLLRPLFQEKILPNLAYIGGPGELAYWFQLKGIFESENLPFPILFPRKFATIIPTTISEKLNASGIELEDVFLSEDSFKGLLLEKLEVEKLGFEEEEALLQKVKQLLQTKAAKADKTLVVAAEAEMVKVNKGISDFGKRINKALENRHDVELNKFQNLRKKLFPEGGLQERHDNFLNFYINNPNLISELHTAFNPFQFQMEISIK